MFVYYTCEDSRGTMAKEPSCSSLSQAAAAAAMFSCFTHYTAGLHSSFGCNVYSSTEHGCGPCSFAEVAEARGFITEPKTKCNKEDKGIRCEKYRYALSKIGLSQFNCLENGSLHL